MTEVEAFVETCGKTGVDVKDQAGFVVNALLFPYLNNAVKLYDAGVAARDDIDAAMKGGCNFPMGPLELLDLVGLDTSLSILDALHQEFGDPNFAPALLLAPNGGRQPPRPEERRRLLRLRQEVTPRTTRRSLPHEGEWCRGRPTVGDAHVLRSLVGAGVERAVPQQPGARARPVSRSRSTSPRRPATTPTTSLARGEVGKVGVPVPHLGEMRVLFDELPLDDDEHVDDDQRHRDVAVRHVPGAGRGARRRRRRKLAGTTQNDIVKEYLARGTYIFGPEPSRRLTVDLICHAVRHVPKWNPINVCSYHLQEAGATPVEEVAYALATAIGVLDAVRDSGQVSPDDLPEVVGRISFFVNSGIRFVEEMCKHRAFGRLWDRITAERYGVTDERLRRFRFGVQVNSLGLTEAQPENNVQRIVLETLGVTLSHDARARAIQLPAWNEALGPPAPVGPAVVAAHPAGAGLRDRSPRVRRPVRRLTRGGEEDGGAGRGRRGRARLGARGRRAPSP